MRLCASSVCCLHCACLRARLSTVSFVLGAAAQLLLSFALSAFGVLVSVGHFWTMGAVTFGAICFFGLCDSIDSVIFTR